MNLGVIFTQSSPLDNDQPQYKITHSLNLCTMYNRMIKQTGFKDWNGKLL